VKQLRRPDISVPTRLEILAAAGRLFAERGFAEASMREIAGAARVSKAALYYHFRDKGQLYQILVAEGIRTLTQSLRSALRDGTPQVQLARVIIIHLQFAELHPELARVLVHEEMRNGAGRGRLRTIIARHREEELALFESLIRQGMERGEFKTVEPALSASALSAALHVLSAGFALAPTGQSLQEVAQNTLDVLLNGLATTPQPMESITALLGVNSSPNGGMEEGS
jgi:AcrR family transcriptional regulator